MDDLAYLKKYYQGPSMEEAINQVRAGIPVQYVVGNVDFGGNLIMVDQRVLIPRFETEELVFKTINKIKNLFPTSKITIVDIGTGSGCIAISLKKAFPESTVSATDISLDALEVAKQNIIFHQLEIPLKQGSYLEPLEGHYDVVISNPPYLKPADDVMELVKNNEPHHALYEKQDGLFAYETILSGIKPYLNDSFLLAFEIGEEQGAILTSLAHVHFPTAIITIEKDLPGKDRFLFIENK